MKKLSWFQKFLMGSSLALGLVFFGSIGFSHKKLHPLKPAAAKLLAPLEQEESRLEISAIVLNGRESKAVFNHDFPDREVYPLQITIQNNTANTYALSA